MEPTRQQIAIEAAKHKRFNETDVNEYWTNRANSYARQYDGTFGFMTSIKKDFVEAGKALSPGQVKAVLNCARKEGEDSALQAMESQFAPTPVEMPTGMPAIPTPVKDTELDLALDFDFDMFDAANEASQEVKSDMKDDPNYQELAKINSKILEIKARMQNIQVLHDPLSVLITDSQAEEVELFESFSAQITAIREARAAAEAEMKALAVELNNIQQELENQQRLHALTLQNIAAQQLFDETKKQFDELRDGQPWDAQIMPFQWDDVCFMAAAFLSEKNGVLNANDMGLGKTAESAFLLDIITPLFIQKYKRAPLVLWLTKKTLRFSTFKEIRRWNADRQIVVLDGNETMREFQLELAVANNMMVIANYDMMNTTSILKYEWDFVFMDEVHKLKGGANSRPTQIFENAVQLAKKARFLVPLSGSPIQNHPAEMWCYLHLFDPQRFPDVRRFKREYCFGWGEKDADGNPIISVDWERIIRAMKDRVIRHSKAECLPDLPDKTREFRFVERGPEQDAVYQQLRSEFFTYLDENKEHKLNITSLLAQLTRLRQVNIIPASVRIKLENGMTQELECYESAKIDECMEIVDQLVGSGEQVVVFSSQFNEPLKEVQRRVAIEQNVTCEILSGERSNEFEQIESAFQNGEIKVLCVNMKTGGEGLNLQKSDAWVGGANHAIFLDLWWNPKFNEQAEDRLHRKGQKDAVTIHILQCENSVDQFIAAKLEEKEGMIQGIMERDELRTGSDWADVLRDML